MSSTKYFIFGTIKPAGTTRNGIFIVRFLVPFPKVAPKVTYPHGRTFVPLRPIASNPKQYFRFSLFNPRHSNVFWYKMSKGLPSSIRHPPTKCPWIFSLMTSGNLPLESPLTFLSSMKLSTGVVITFSTFGVKSSSIFKSAATLLVARTFRSLSSCASSVNHVIFPFAMICSIASHSW